MPESQRHLPDEAATAALAARLAGIARPGDALLLHGPLGAGKTSFARAFLRALAADPQLEVPSPSFTLLQRYETARGPVFHYDFWRLVGPEAIAELGWDDALEGIVLAEWPDRLGDLTPGDALSLHFSLLPEGRRVTLQGEQRWLDAC